MSQPSNETPEILFAEWSPSEEVFEFVLGSLVAGAAADSLGWPTEFMRSPKSLQTRFGVDRITDYVSWRKQVGGRFNTYIDFIGAGEYSDDTQLTLAVARSLLGDGSIDQEYFTKKELVRWLDYARGAGRTVVGAAKAAGRKRTRWNQNFFRVGKINYWDSGANGAAMRVAPLAWAALETDRPPMEAAFANAITTHGHPRAQVGALAYVAALFEIHRRRKTDTGTAEFLESIRGWLREWHPARSDNPAIREWAAAAAEVRPDWAERFDDTLDEFDAMSRTAAESDTEAVLDALGCFARDTRGSGTATVAAALHLFCRYGANVETAVIEAVNAIPSDTDTIGAFAGSMAGLYGGYGAVPERWTEKLQDLPYMVSLSEAVSKIAVGEFESAATKTSGLRARPSRHDYALPDVMEQLASDAVEEGMRVRHDVLGSGWVKAVHAQEIRRRGGGQQVYARVELDMGQMCQFRAYLSPKR